MKTHQQTHTTYVVYDSAFSLLDNEFDNSFDTLTDMANHPHFLAMDDEGRVRDAFLDEEDEKLAA